MPETQAHPSPNLFFETANAYQRSAALKAAIDLGLFTAIGKEGATALEPIPIGQLSHPGISPIGIGS